MDNEEKDIIKKKFKSELKLSILFSSILFYSLLFFRFDHFWFCLVCLFFIFCFLIVLLCFVLFLSSSDILIVATNSKSGHVVDGLNKIRIKRT